MTPVAPWTIFSSRLSAGGRVAVLSSLQTGALAEVLKGFARAFGSERVARDRLEGLLGDEAFGLFGIFGGRGHVRGGTG